MSDKFDAGANRPTQASALIDALHALLAAPHEADFYDRYASLVEGLCGAQCALVVERDLENDAVLGQHGDPANVALLLGALTPERWQALQDKGYTHETQRHADGMGTIVLMVRLLDSRASVLLLALPERDRAHLKEALVRAMLVRDVRQNLAAAPVGEASQELASFQHVGNKGLLDVLSLTTEIMQAPRFGAAALTLVNGLIRLLGLRQVALCWRVGGDCEVVTISHLERFEKTSRLVQGLQAAAAEVLSVDGVLSATTLANADGLASTPPAHQQLLSLMEGMNAVMGLPVRDSSGQTQAVVLCVSDRGALDPEAVNHVLLMLEMVLPRLIDARARHMNFLQRLKMALLDKLSLLVGPKRPWLKFWTLCISLAVLVLLFGRMPYRVEASAQLSTDSMRMMTSQMDGKLQDVLVDVGDLVVAGQTIARLDTSDLRQQELEILSEFQRYQAEEDKARAAGALADLQVASFRAGQSQARLQRIRYLLDQAQLQAPFDGVIVEGERRKLLGASVRRGDTLFRIAQVKNLYLVLQVPERDIRSITEQSEGKMVLLSQPGQTISFHVSNFVPMAQVKGDEGNQFLLKAIIDVPPQVWWRPGMTGLAKIDAGYRNIGWVLFHRLYDTFRLWFWL